MPTILRKRHSALLTSAAFAVTTLAVAAAVNVARAANDGVIFDGAATTNAIRTGTTSIGISSSTDVGAQAKGSGSIAIGDGAGALGGGSIAIGCGANTVAATCTTAGAGPDSAIAIGNNSSAQGANSIALGGTSGAA